MSPGGLLTHLELYAASQNATFGAGCFWGVEASFAAIPGVTATAVGYEGGNLDRPTYKDVCTDQTGHAEVVELDFDPEKVSYGSSSTRSSTSTTPPPQPPGSRLGHASTAPPSFSTRPEQEQQAKAKIDELTASGHYAPRRIVTKVEPAQTFWRAEDYHQKYLEKRGQASCHI